MTDLTFTQGEEGFHLSIEPSIKRTSLQMTQSEVGLSAVLASSSAFQKRIARMTADAIQKKHDFDMTVVLWHLEQRNLRSCSCGRQYKRLRWSLKHLFNTGHSPPELDAK